MPAPPVAPPPATTGPTYRLIGRFDTANPNDIRFTWSGSAIETHFYGTTLTVGLSDTEKVVYSNVLVSSSFDVIVDGALRAPLVLQHGTSRYALVQGLSKGEHTVRLVKRTEAQLGICSFTGFRTDGVFLAPHAAPARRIEIVGDSLSAGYGILGTMTGPDDVCHFTAETENSGVTFGALAASALGADYMNISYSGQGITRNQVAGGTRLMPAMYERVFPNDNNSAWSFSGWTPQVVVLAIGSNDFYNNAPDPADFEAGYAGFVQQIRDHYPKATILCTMGPTWHDDEARAEITHVITKLNDAGDPNVAFLYFEPSLLKGVWGCDYHPAATTHAAMAQVLQEAIRQTLGW